MRIASLMYPVCAVSTMIFACCRGFEEMKVSFTTNVISYPLNVFLDFCLIFGNFGAGAWDPGSGCGNRHCPGGGASDPMPVPVPEGEVWGKLNRLGLKEKSVGYVDNEFFQQNVPRRSVDKMAESQEKILSGEITVKSYYDFANEAEYQQLLDSVAP